MIPIIANTLPIFVPPKLSVFNVYGISYSILLFLL
jgi:hypothetical protein